MQDSQRLLKIIQNHLFEFPDFFLNVFLIRLVNDVRGMVVFVFGCLPHHTDILFEDGAGIYPGSVRRFYAPDKFFRGGRQQDDQASSF